MIPAIDVPAVGSRTVSVSNQLIKEEENGENEDDDDGEYDDQELNMMENLDSNNNLGEENLLPKLIEKSVIVHRDENGFGLRVKGQAPVFVEHVHENGAAWRAGVRQMDRISKVNGVPVTGADHKEVVLMFKSCTRFVGLTLLSCLTVEREINNDNHRDYHSASPAGVSVSQTLTTLPQNLIGSVPFGPSGSFSSQRLSSVTLSCDGQHHYRALNASSQSSMTTATSRHHKLALDRLQHPHYFHHSFSTADNRLGLGKLRPPNGSASSGTSLTNSLLAGRPTQQQQQQQHNSIPLARRSESVTHRPNHSNQNMPKQQQVSMEESKNLPFNKRSTVCANCRSLARKSPDLVGCVQCQLNLSSSCDANGANSRSNEGLRQRSFVNLKDSRQQYHRDTCNNSRTSPVRSQMPQFKLTQSDSMRSLNQKEVSKQSSGDASAANIPSIVLNKQPKTVNKRLEIIREFIDTEKAHTDRLRCLDELFYRPLKDGGYMTTEQLRMVFSCHRTLYKIHRQIYRTLVSSNHNLYAEPMIGSALLEIFEGDLKRRLERAACSFCSAQSNNADLLNKLTRRDTKVGDFLAQVTSQQMVGRLGIKDLLASCFQRLTKYPLLLENLLKATPQSLSADAALPTEKRRAKDKGFKSYNSVGVESGGDNRPQDGDQLDDEESKEEEDEEEEEEEEAIRNSRRMLAISLAEEREFIERALNQSRQILIRVNDSVKVAMSHNKIKEIWKRTDKYPGVPLIDITKQQVVHEGLLTLRLSKRSFDVYVLLLNDYLIILTREGQDKYRLKFFTPDGKSSATGSSNVYSPVFVIDEHLTTRDAATDENGFYLLCKRKDDSRIYEFASRSPAERLKWRDRIQWTIERQMSKADRRGSCDSTITKSSSELSAKQESDTGTPKITIEPIQPPEQPIVESVKEKHAGPESDNKHQPTKIEGTISYVEDDGIVMPSKMGSSRALVDQAIQVTILDT